MLPQPCQPGYYCPYNDTRQECPIQTYRSEEGGMNLTDCYPCPAGYFCNTEAMADYEHNPCAPGFYCPEATYSPIPCPPGTYRAEEGAGNYTDCHLCLAGYYCPDTNATINGTQCDEGYFCPDGSQNQTICQPGYYCNMSMTQQICPPGYYCPLASPYPRPCPLGHFCPVDNSTGDPVGKFHMKCSISK